MICQFQVPDSGSIIESSSEIVQIQNQSSEVMETVKKNALEALRMAAVYAIQRIFGYSQLGQAGKKLVGSVLEGQEGGESISKQEKEAAIVEAFKKVASQFVYDDKKGLWFYRSELSDYELQLVKAPVELDYDRLILTRLLVELAEVHEGINVWEEKFLMELVDLSPLRLREIQVMGPVSKLEAQSITKEVQPTVFLLLYTMSIVDEHLDDSELEWLEGLANKLEIPSEQKENLAMAAKDYIFMSALNFDFSKEQLNELASQLKVSEEYAERALIRFRKQHYQGE